MLCMFFFPNFPECPDSMSLHPCWLKGTLTWLSILLLLAVFPFDGGWGRHPLDLRVSVLLIHHWNVDISHLNSGHNYDDIIKVFFAGAVLPFSACSMICRRAFFRLLALSISCSLERYVLPSEPDSPPLSPGLELPLSWLGTEPAGTTWVRQGETEKETIPVKYNLPDTSWWETFLFMM